MILIRAFPFSSAFRSALSSSSFYRRWPDTDLEVISSVFDPAAPVGLADLKVLLTLFFDAGHDRNLSL